MHRTSNTVGRPPCHAPSFDPSHQVLSPMSGSTRSRLEDKDDKSPPYVIMSYTLTFVTPRYGAGIMGGAEQGARALAVRLSKEGWPVRVITSCAKSHTTWADVFPPGVRTEEGVEVLRCPVDRHRDPKFDVRSTRLLRNPKSVDSIAAWDWIDRQGPDSSALLEAVAAVDSGILVFYPYLYQPTARGIRLARVPSVLHAACHREPPIDLPVFDGVFKEADALAHHSRAEQELVLERFASTRNRPQAVIGLPVEIDGPVNPDEARSAFGLGDEPFVMALGRIDAGKGTSDLINLFLQFRNANRRSRLVLAGPVVGKPPKAEGVTVLGPVPHQHKFGLLASADVLINPSPNESFSTVIVEAMLVRTPVLVNGWCLPLREHCENSGAGLWYTGIADFHAALCRLTTDRGLHAAIGQIGRRYAERLFSWPAVRMRYERLLDRI